MSLAVDAALQRVAVEMLLDRQDSRLQQDLQDGQVQAGFLLRFQLPLRPKCRVHVILVNIRIASLMRVLLWCQVAKIQKIRHICRIKLQMKF